MDCPAELKYNRSHEWCRVTGDLATIGISDYAQAALGDIVYVELPPVGTTLIAGETCGTIESVKAAEDLYSPVSGEVVAVNELLEDAVETINDAPYDAGWLFQVRLSDPAELDALLDAAAYAAHCESEH